MIDKPNVLRLNTKIHIINPWINITNHKIKKPNIIKPNIKIEHYKP